MINFKKGVAIMGEKANVLVMGNSGAGKSTLINSVFNFDRAEVGNGNTVTKKMTIYENEDVNFRAIDTKGLEYGLRGQIQAKNAIKKWSKNSVKSSNAEEYIHIIWYCVDATSKRFFDKNIDTIKNVSKMWKNIPIIIVLTKSYSEIETAENIGVVRNRIEQYKDKDSLNIDGIIPVVAQQFPINTATIVPAIGVDRLIEITNEIMPESFKINKESVADFALRLKRNNANILVVTATSGAGVVGAVPIPFADSLILTPLQIGMIKGIMRIFDFKGEDDSYNKIAETLIGGGVVTIGAKTIISSLKAIPGLNLAAYIINMIVASVITAVLGEITIKIMEKITKGELDPSNLEWMRKFAENEFMKRVGKYIEKIGKSAEPKDSKNIEKVIANILTESN